MKIVQPGQTPDPAGKKTTPKARKKDQGITALLQWLTREVGPDNRSRGDR